MKTRILSGFARSTTVLSWHSGTKEDQDSILSLVYTDKAKVAVLISMTQKKKKRYTSVFESFQKSVYNYIKEDVDPTTQKLSQKSISLAGPHLQNAIKPCIEIL